MFRFLRMHMPVMRRMGLGLVVLLGVSQTRGAEEIFSDNVRIQTDSAPTLFLDHVGLQKWSIRGGDFFAVFDEAIIAAPLIIKKGAPGSSIFIDELGRVGIGHFEVAEDLHVFSADINATLRLESPDSFISSAQAWNLNGSPFAFTLKDVSANRVPVTVETETPSHTLYLSSLGGGHVGIGTTTPQLINGASVAGNSRHLNLTASTGTARAVVQGKDAAESYLVHTGGSAGRKIVRTRVAGGKYLISTMSDDLASNSEVPFSIDLSSKNVGIKTSSPAKPFQVGDAGANDGNGAHVTAGGVWTNASSRSVKDDIQPVSLDTARDTIRALQPVTYRYKNERDEQYVGFIAEDVPDLVATNDRRSLASMDVAAVLTRVVQDQDRQLDEQRQTITQLTRRLVDLEQKFGGGSNPTK